MQARVYGGSGRENKKRSTSCRKHRGDGDDATAFALNRKTDCASCSIAHCDLTRRAAGQKAPVARRCPLLRCRKNQR